MSINYINKNGLSFNEGGPIFNFHIGWKYRFIYIYLLGIRLTLSQGHGWKYP